ncbi:hypothetical protein ARV1_gp10 [Acidianus rod-shaped virus 1]|uniref:Uncharacterized protein n=1 Tax=Acidianus rod-shaped virus 1 TaxID=309181 RepID=Q50I61_9VIRU|nr:hypothetical protein ARV1_gp10 [Acidianus rod-shaped virus 1]CAI44165.1 hypothetical protein [Acidianus rod-shaped virus 1]
MAFQSGIWSIASSTNFLIDIPLFAQYVFSFVFFLGLILMVISTVFSFSFLGLYCDFCIFICVLPTVDN